MELKRVVITGMGALTPLGNNVADYWSSLIAGVSGAAPITLFDASKFKTQFACELKGFDAINFLKDQILHLLDPPTLVLANERGHFTHMNFVDIMIYIKNV